MNKEKWEIKKLGEVCEIVSGSTPKTNVPEFWEGGDLKWITPAEITNKSVYVFDTERHITQRAVQNTNLKPFPKDTVILSSRAPIGKVAIAGSEMFCNQGFKNLVCNNEFIKPLFLFYFLKNNTEYLNSLGRGATFKEISKQIVSNIQINLPPLSTQEKIVSELDTLHRLKELQEQQLAELDNLAQSTFFHLFGDPIENEKGWEVKAFKVGINEMFLGPFGSSLKNDCFVPIDKSYCMVYEQKHAIRKTLDVETRYIDMKKYDELKRFEVEAGDFLMSCRGTIGEIYRLPDNAKNGIIHPSLMKIRIKNNVFNPIFFETLLYKIVQQESVMGSGVKMAITAKSLGNKLIPIPPLSLQTHFSERIERIEAQKELIKRSIAETQTLIDYTMDKYFG